MVVQALENRSTKPSAKLAAKTRGKYQMMNYYELSKTKPWTYKKIPLLEFVKILRTKHKKVRLRGYHKCEELEIQATDKNGDIWYLELNPKKRYTYTLKTLKNKWYTEKYKGGE